MIFRIGKLAPNYEHIFFCSDDFNLEVTYKQQYPCDIPL